MIKKLFTITVLITLLLSSCSALAATEPPTATETQPPTATSAPATNTLIPTETFVTLPESTLTATPQPTRPPNDPNCTNSAGFVADVTIPDNTEIVAGTTFRKTWRVSNTGTCIWASDYTLTYYSAERMNAPASVPLPLTYPGQTADISIDLTAPNSLGKHQGNFVIKNAEGLIMKVNDDSRLWVIITSTTNEGAATSAATAAAAASTAIAAPGLVTSTCAFTSETSNITDTLNAISTYRIQNNLAPYNTNSMLAQAAQSHANDMACNSLTGHAGSNGSTIQSRVTAAGYTFAYVDENINVSSPALSGQAVVNAWINDATNTQLGRNLVSDTYIDVGVGYSFFNNKGYYVVVFGTP